MECVCRLTDFKPPQPYHICHFHASFAASPWFYLSKFPKFFTLHKSFTIQSVNIPNMCLMECRVPSGDMPPQVQLRIAEYFHPFCFHFCFLPFFSPSIWWIHLDILSCLNFWQLVVKELQDNKDKSFNNLKRKLKWFEKKNELNGLMQLFSMLPTTNGKWFPFLKNVFSISWVACTFKWIVCISFCCLLSWGIQLAC